MTFHSVITIRNDTRYLAFLRGWMEAARCLTGQKGFSRRQLYAVSLSLIEAVDNAIFHARPPSSSGRKWARRFRRGTLPIRVGLMVASGKLMVTVADRGLGFKDRRTPLLLEAMHGRGLLLMRRLMTRVTHRRGHGWHSVRMVLKR